MIGKRPQHEQLFASPQQHSVISSILSSESSSEFIESEGISLDLTVPDKSICDTNDIPLVISELRHRLDCLEELIGDFNIERMRHGDEKLAGVHSLATVLREHTRLQSAHSARFSTLEEQMKLIEQKACDGHKNVQMAARQLSPVVSKQAAHDVRACALEERMDLVEKSAQDRRFATLDCRMRQIDDVVQDDHRNAALEERLDLVDDVLCEALKRRAQWELAVHVRMRRLEQQGTLAERIGEHLDRIKCEISCSLDSTRDCSGSDALRKSIGGILQGFSSCEATEQDALQLKSGTEPAYVKEAERLVALKPLT